MGHSVCSTVHPTHAWMNLLKAKWNHRHSQPSCGRTGLASNVTSGLHLKSCLMLPSVGYYYVLRPSIFYALVCFFPRLGRNVCMIPFLTLGTHIVKGWLGLVYFYRFLYIFGSQCNEWTYIDIIELWGRIRETKGEEKGSCGHCPHVDTAHWGQRNGWGPRYYILSFSIKT